jgi:ArsR family transcriptional regulator
MDTLAQLFKALADTSRLRILNLLFHSGELCVCDIESVMGFTQTKVSRHLAYLTRAGLVAYRKQGLWMLYSIPRPENEDQRRVINCLGTLLKANTVAQRDARRLESRISAGCCATFERVKPGTKRIAKSMYQRCDQEEECLS